MMNIDTATKLIALLAVIDDKKQGTHTAKDKPPPTKVAHFSDGNIFPLALQPYPSTIHP
jgi:hypothetical protein